MYEAQAAHLGDQPEGGFFVFKRNPRELGAKSKNARQLVDCCRVGEPPLPLGRTGGQILMEAKSK